MKKILFISWDGAGSTYIDGLFLSIFEGLHSFGFDVKVLQLSWSSKEEIVGRRERLKDRNIDYEHVRIYRTFPFGYLFSILYAVWKLRQNIRKEKIDIVFPRSILPAFILLIARIKQKHIVYDSDGFPEDEKVDFGLWNSLGLPYFFYRTVEYLIFHKARAIVTRSKKAKSVIEARSGSTFRINKVFVIWNGRDSAFFKLYPPNYRSRLRDINGIRINEIVIVYSGSVGEKYMSGEMLHLFEFLKRRLPILKVIIITNFIKDLERIAKQQGIYLSDYIVKSVRQDEVCNYLNAADFGIFLCKNSFSTEAVFPTKLSEYLLAGLPTIISSNIGDCDEIAAANKAGIYSISNYSDRDFNLLSDWIVRTNQEGNSIRNQIADYALQHLTSSKTVSVVKKAIDFV